MYQTYWTQCLLHTICRSRTDSSVLGQGLVKACEAMSRKTVALTHPPINLPTGMTVFLLTASGMSLSPTHFWGLGFPKIQKGNPIEERRTVVSTHPSFAPPVHLRICIGNRPTVVYGVNTLNILIRKQEMWLPLCRSSYRTPLPCR